MNATKTERKIKNRLVFRFPAFTVDEPITYNLIKEYDIIINILNADISHGKEGILLVEMKGLKSNMDAALTYLAKKDIEVSPVQKTILHNDELCVHCGACSSVCFSGALEMDKKDRSLIFEPEKCIACELCIKACPLQLFELNFGIH
jgi:ferredoxin